MAIFFKTAPKRTHRFYEPVVMNALASEPILDLKTRRNEAVRLLDELDRSSERSGVVWWRVAVAFLLLVAVFVIAILVATAYPKASETLLHCFELLFTATIGLLGIEAAKNG